MKNLLTLGLLSFLFLLGCDQELDLTSQTTPVEMKLISLPEPQGLRINTIFTTTKTINGFQGGTLKITKNYRTLKNTRVSISASLKFQRNSFDGTREITMTLDDVYGSAQFSPEGEFYKPALYNASFDGLDLTGVNPSTVDFVYINDDGTIEPIEYDNLVVDVSSGFLMVTNAKLPHFSRYGFVN